MDLNKVYPHTSLGRRTWNTDSFFVLKKHYTACELFGRFPFKSIDAGDHGITALLLGHIPHTSQQ